MSGLCDVASCTDLKLPGEIVCAGHWMPQDGTLAVKGGRSGKKIHRGYVGSSVLRCGHWLRVDGEAFRLTAHQLNKAPREDFCQKCWGK